MAAADNTQAGGTLFGFKNLFTRRKRVDIEDYKPDWGIVGEDGMTGQQRYEAALREESVEEARRDQLSAALSGLGKTDGGGRTTVGGARPSISPVTASPYGFPMNIDQAGGNVMPGASTQPFGSMEQLMARANLLEQAKRKRVF